MFLEWENNSGKLQIISGKFQNSEKFQNNAINDVKQISLSQVINNNYFMSTFFRYTITEWNELDLSIRNSTSLHIVKGRLLQFVRPLEDSVFTCHNPIGIKYLTRLRLIFSHLRYHKFQHGFLDAVDPLCSCSTAIESIVHYFLHCLNFSTVQNTFLNEIAIVDRSIHYWSRWNQNYSNFPLWKLNLFCQW